jgi:hypothetical protein
MIITSYSNIDFIQGNIGYGNTTEGITDWRIENTSNSIFNISNSTSSTSNISIIDNGNIGIGITPISSSSKLEILGDINISDIYKKNNNDVIQNTSNYIATTSNILTNYYINNKPIAGNGINISSTLPPVISLTQWITSGTTTIYNITNIVNIGSVISTSLKASVSIGGNITQGITYYILKIFAGAFDNYANNTVTLIGLSTEDSNWTKCAIGHCKTDTFNRGDIVFLCNNANNTSSVSMTDEVMRITRSGNVGINITNPTIKLEIGQGIGSFTSQSRTYMNIGFDYLRTATGSWGTIGLRSYSSMWATNIFLASSDIRIKEDIQDIIDDTALYKILSIEPKTYKYIDKIERGDKKVYGFISQQIKEVIPEAVSIQKSYIPNIMLLANYNNKIITLHSLTNCVIKNNDKIKCFDKNNKDVFIEVEEIIDSLNFRIKELDNPYTDTTIFVYGIEVGDLHILDKNYIYTLNICATQELHKRIESLNAITQSNENRINELKAKILLLLNNTM